MTAKDLTSSKGARPPYLEPPSNGVYHTTDYFRTKVPQLNKMELAHDFGKKLRIYVALKNAAALAFQGSVEEGRYLVRNEEIDIETPTGLKETPYEISYGHDRFNTWVGENIGEYTDNFDNLGQEMNDGQFHVYRFDWHTASPAPPLAAGGVLHRWQMLPN